MFAHRGVIGGVTEELITYDKNITPEQEAILRELNFHEYPTIQELSGSKDNTNSSNSQEKGGENSSGGDNSSRTMLSVTPEEDKSYLSAVEKGDAVRALV